jgi:hypothetical protein
MNITEVNLFFVLHNLDFVEKGVIGPKQEGWGCIRDIEIVTYRRKYEPWT